MKNIIRHFSLFLATVMALGALSSCTAVKKNEGETGGEVSVSEDQTEETTESETTENPQAVTTSFSRDADDDGKTVICIDPGHGFGDVGCESDYMSCYEKDITLSVAKLLKSELLAADDEIEIILIHDGVSYPSAPEIMSQADKCGVEYDSEKMIDNNIFSAYERVIYENVLDAQYGLDLYVSLHVNSVENADYVDGISIDYCATNPYASMLGNLSSAAKMRFSDALSSEVTVFADSYDDSYIVTKYTNVPSVLIEMGYSTNPTDAANLQSSAWQQKFAENLCTVIRDTLG